MGALVSVTSASAGVSVDSVAIGGTDLQPDAPGTVTAASRPASRTFTGGDWPSGAQDVVITASGTIDSIVVYLFTMPEVARECLPTGAGLADPFNRLSIAPKWTFSTGDVASATVAATNFGAEGHGVEIDINDGSGEWFDGAEGTLLYQAHDNSDFDISVYMGTDDLDESITSQGFLFWQDDDNWVRVDRGFQAGDDDFLRGVTTNNNTALGSDTLTKADLRYIRVRRTGTLFEGFRSDDGINWIFVGDATAGFTINRIGLWYGKGSGTVLDNKRFLYFQDETDKARVEDSGTALQFLSATTAAATSVSLPFTEDTDQGAALVGIGIIAADDAAGAIAAGAGSDLLDQGVVSGTDGIRYAVVSRTTPVSGFTAGGAIDGSWTGAASASAAGLQLRVEDLGSTFETIDFGNVSVTTSSAPAAAPRTLAFSHDNNRADLIIFAGGHSSVTNVSVGDFKAEYDSVSALSVGATRAGHQDDIPRFEAFLLKGASSGVNSGEVNFDLVSTDYQSLMIVAISVDGVEEAGGVGFDNDDAAVATMSAVVDVEQVGSVIVALAGWQNGLGNTSPSANLVDLGDGALSTGSSGSQDFQAYLGQHLTTALGNLTVTASTDAADDGSILAVEFKRKSSPSTEASLTAPIGAFGVTTSGTIATALTGLSTVAVGAIGIEASGVIDPGVEGALASDIGAFEVIASGLITPPLSGSLSPGVGPLGATVSGLVDAGLDSSTSIDTGALGVDASAQITAPADASVSIPVGVIGVAASGSIAAVLSGASSSPIGSVGLSATGSITAVLDAAVISPVGGIGLTGSALIEGVLDASASLDVGSLGLTPTAAIDQGLEQGASAELGAISLTTSGDITAPLESSGAVDVGAYGLSASSAITPVLSQSIDTDIGAIGLIASGVVDAGLAGSAQAGAGPIGVNATGILGDVLLSSSVVDLGEIQATTAGAIAPVLPASVALPIGAIGAIAAGVITPPLEASSSHTIGAVTIVASGAVDGSLVGSTAPAVGPLDIIASGFIEDVLSSAASADAGGIGLTASGLIEAPDNQSEAVADIGQLGFIASGSITEVLDASTSSPIGELFLVASGSLDADLPVASSETEGFAFRSTRDQRAARLAGSDLTEVATEATNLIHTG